MAMPRRTHRTQRQYQYREEKSSICNIPFQLIMTEDELVSYMTPVSYSQWKKGVTGIYLVSMG
jgi:hypothetical protein